jgi:hypothetical protein
MLKTLKLSDSVESLFERWPGTVQVFIRHQMACPGCYLAEFDSLESALLSLSGRAGTLSGRAAFQIIADQTS